MSAIYPFMTSPSTDGYIFSSPEPGLTGAFESFVRFFFPPGPDQAQIAFLETVLCYAPYPPLIGKGQSFDLGSEWL